MSLILIDFDGVILKNSKASNYISKKVTNYIQWNTGIKDRKVCEALNKELYTSHGHTLIGLQKHGFSNTHRDFNDYLYGNKDSFSGLTLSPGEKYDWDKFLFDMRENGKNVKLFSNSGMEWMTHFIGYDASLFELHDVLEGQYMLKPEKNIYDSIVSLYPDNKYYFIDDKVGNFTEVQSDTQWVKLWMYDGQMDEPLKLGKNFYCINSFDTASQVIIDGDGDLFCDINSDAVCLM
jgi:hypothetical protein